MKVLITGGAGYLGSILMETLKNVAEITCFDNFLYDQGTLVSRPILNSKVRFFKEDINKWSSNLKKAIREADIIIPLAALVGAPLCDQKRGLAIQTNYKWFEQLLTMTGDQTIIYPNTNSGYGTTGEDICTEETPSNPISLYATTKQNSENILLSHHPTSICFRLATVFGWSYRPRTDLLINNLVKIAKEEGHITLFDGHFRRNYIHVQDIARAFIFAIYKRKEMHGNIYNLGNDSLNMTKQQLVDRICEILGTTYSIDSSRTDPDKRDYLVSSQKLYDLGFSCQYNLKRGVKEMYRFYDLLSPSDIDKCRNY